MNSASALDTDLFAGGWLGLIGSVIMFGLGMWYPDAPRITAQQRADGIGRDRRSILAVSSPS